MPSPNCDDDEKHGNKWDVDDGGSKRTRECVAHAFELTKTRDLSSDWRCLDRGDRHVYKLMECRHADERVDARSEIRQDPRANVAQNKVRSDHETGAQRKKKHDPRRARPNAQIVYMHDEEWDGEGSEICQEAENCGGCDQRFEAANDRAQPVLLRFRPLLVVPIELADMIKRPLKLAGCRFTPIRLIAVKNKKGSVRIAVSNDRQCAFVALEYSGKKVARYASDVDMARRRAKSETRNYASQAFDI